MVMYVLNSNAYEWGLMIKVIDLGLQPPQQSSLTTIFYNCCKTLHDLNHVIFVISPYNFKVHINGISKFSC